MARPTSKRAPAPRRRPLREPKHGSAAFLDVDLSPAEFRRLGTEAVALLTEYYASLRGRRILPDATPAALRRRFDEPLPRRGRDPHAVLRRWRSSVVPYSGHLGSPRFFGYVQGSGLQIGAIADALASAQDPNVADWRMSPAETEVERCVVRWIAGMIGYPTTGGGTLTSGGMAANHTALQVALHTKSPYDMTEDGLQAPGRRGRFTVYLSDHEGHVTIRRAAELLNLGRGAVRPVRSRDDFTLDPEALERQLRDDRARGDRPFCVVAQAGSINVGAIDPLAEIADICRSHDLWFHVDGAAGAFGALLPELRPSFAGIERADSVTVDPHKWLYLSKECGGLLVRDESLLRRTFSAEATYLDRQTEDAGAGTNFRALSTQSSRGFRALKVWMAVQQLGTDGYRRLFRQNLACVAHLHERVRDDPDFEVLHEPRLYIYSFRYRPHRFAQSTVGAAGDDEVAGYLDRLNRAIAETANRTGEVFLTTTRIRGRVALRVSVCNHRTTMRDIDRLFELLRRLAQREDAAAR
jgi:aromatic-L-amino-acid/L-tryptophan decarboxylase